MPVARVELNDTSERLERCNVLSGAAVCDGKLEPAADIARDASDGVLECSDRLWELFRFL